MSHDPSEKQPSNPAKDEELTDEELLQVVGGSAKFPVGHPIRPPFLLD